MILEVQDLRTSFDTPAGTVRAVDGVSFALDAGRTLGVVGESGSGKTVLSRSIMNLLPRRGVTRSGRVRFQGRDITDLGPKEMTSVWGAEMAMVFQDPMTSLNPVMRIGPQITESLRFHLGLSRPEAEREALALLRSVNIPEPKRRFREYPHQLSGGMRQRVTIAIALACSPSLLLADEPTTALDVTVQAQILNLLADQQAKRHMAMILVTHDLGVVAGRADEIAVMYAGRVVEKAPTEVLFREMRHPYTEALLASIPRLEHRSHTRLQAIPGRPPDLVHPPAGCRFAPRCASVQQRCLEEDPVLRAAETTGHHYACWYPVGTDEGREARERNVARDTAVHVARRPAARRRPRDIGVTGVPVLTDAAPAEPEGGE
ncbi:MAG TPA: ABC transporter ATP-binding protein [Acidimicrobiia bacterium]|nr:ABC transporter ATP-binding protein [Acidimicrobiia bacterium]